MVISFGGSDNKLTSLEKAKVVMLPVPYGKTVTYRKGTEDGPCAILNASRNMELFDDEIGKEVNTIGINTAEFLEVNDLVPERMVELVEKRVSDIFRQEKLPVILGGEHSITLGGVRSAKKQYKDVSILYFDAHYDLRDTYSGSRYNHGCVARRLLEIAGVVEVGGRSLTTEEKSFLQTKNKNIKAISMLDIINNKDWLNIVNKHLSKNVYITIDLDVLDTSIMPSVGNPEPGGFGWYEFLKAIRNIISKKRIVGFDVVELCPIKALVAPDYLAARLVYKMLGYIFFTHRGHRALNN